jgi:hypothetical protein
LTDEDEQTGVRILRRALEEPVRRIAENAGVDGAVVINNIEESKGKRGYNAATGKYEDLVAAGIIDPTKVVRTALQNAASVAGLLLTTGAAITDAPESKKAAGGPPMGKITTTKKSEVWEIEVQLSLEPEIHGSMLISMAWEPLSSGSRLNFCGRKIAASSVLC